MEKRPYQMKARARAVETTRRKAMQAVVQRALEVGIEGVTLDEIAREAGVTVQTLLRHFGSKQGLFDTTVQTMRSEVLRSREVDPEGGIDGALRTLFGVYETYAETNWQLLRQEGRLPSVQALLEEARQVHRAWLERVFATHLPARGAERTRRVELLFAATDFYVWKLYRRDLKLSRARTERLMREAVEALCAKFERSEEER